MVVNSKGNTKSSPSSACVTVVPQVIIGNPAEVIIDICNNKEKVDLIIMENTGLKGSISHKVSENANRHVMFVH